MNAVYRAKSPGPNQYKRIVSQPIHSLWKQIKNKQQLTEPNRDTTDYKHITEYKTDFTYIAE